MKKIFLTITLLSTLCLLNAEAKKDKKSRFKKLELVSSTDSLSYAYGSDLANQGLNQFLIQTEIITDTTPISADFTKRIDAATTDVEKANLQKELQAKLDSIQKSNDANLNTFFRGLNDQLNIKESDIYKKGAGLAAQIEMMNKGFSEQTFGKNSEQLNNQLIALGMADAITKKTPLIENSSELIQQKADEANARKAKEEEALHAEKIAENDKFMAENAKKPGVVTLPSGIQYKIDKEGTGNIPTASDRVKVHYSGKLLDGTEFDSSIKRGEPITFGVQQVIPGWTEVLQLMPVGSEWTVYIPYSLAYGAKDQGPIPAYSNLVFDINLLDIEK